MLFLLACLSKPILSTATWNRGADIRIQEATELPDFSEHGSYDFSWVRKKEKVHESIPGVLVGGPCFSVAYFYRDDYKIWNSFKTFVDKTNGELDFYSFHAYD